MQIKMLRKNRILSAIMEFNKIIIKMIMMIMELAPIGVFSLIVRQWKTGDRSDNTATKNICWCMAWQRLHLYYFGFW